MCQGRLSQQKGSTNDPPQVCQSRIVSTEFFTPSRCAVSVPCASGRYAPKWAFSLLPRTLPCGPDCRQVIEKVGERGRNRIRAETYIQQHAEQRTATLAILVHARQCERQVNGRWEPRGLYRAKVALYYPAIDPIGVNHVELQT